MRDATRIEAIAIALLNFLVAARARLFFIPTKVVLLGIPNVLLILTSYPRTYAYRSLVTCESMGGV